MKQGDFTSVAADYAKYRSGYSERVADALCLLAGASRQGFLVADVGAGTGIWTSMLVARGIRCIAVEPNDAMRLEGQHCGPAAIEWKNGSAEDTGLPMTSVDWVTMASSFHWTDAKKALHEFARILRPGGHFTALWNPRDIEGNALHEGIEAIIYRIVPELKRVSSGSKRFMHDLENTIPSTGDFGDVLYLEARHVVSMTTQHYLGVWRSVNDIQSQAGPKRFQRILNEIEIHISANKMIEVPYLTRAWIARKVR